MTYPPYIREKARKLRIERRMPLTQIAECLSIPKTTIWYWIRDIEVVPPGRTLQTRARALARERASLANMERAAKARQRSYEVGQAEFDTLAADPTFRDFVCMYIGEGFRRDRNRVSIANSNPNVLILGNRWIMQFAINKMDYAFQYHADQDPWKLKEFWGVTLGIDPTRIKDQRKSNSNQLAKRNWRSRWGVLTVGTNDTMLRSRLQAWMDRVQDQWLDSPQSGV